MGAKPSKFVHLSPGDLSMIIQRAWEDRTTFETIQSHFGVSESDVVWIMRNHLKQSSFKMWRMRMRGRVTKHRVLRDPDMPYSDHKIANHRRPHC
ncbi:MAG: TIGR03643 family protein [Sulfuritalea sp.]|nr:TIGR03643 family protein [Sulfuritalea sp.]